MLIKSSKSRRAWSHIMGYIESYKHIYCDQQAQHKYSVQKFNLTQSCSPDYSYLLDISDDAQTLGCANWEKHLNSTCKSSVTIQELVGLHRTKIWTISIAGETESMSHSCSYLSHLDLHAKYSALLMDEPELSSSVAKTVREVGFSDFYYTI